eukprot:Nk52_evm7s321 gene=Nk52_evmTU7s321
MRTKKSTVNKWEAHSFACGQQGSDVRVKERLLEQVKRVECSTSENTRSINGREYESRCIEQRARGQGQLDDENEIYKKSRKEVGSNHVGSVCNLPQQKMGNEEGIAYANPPWPLIWNCLVKVQLMEKWRRIVLVVPKWETKAWWPVGSVTEDVERPASGDQSKRKAVCAGEYGTQESCVSSEMGYVDVLDRSSVSKKEEAKIRKALNVVAGITVLPKDTLLPFEAIPVWLKILSEDVPAREWSLNSEVAPIEEGKSICFVIGNENLEVGWSSTKVMNKHYTLNRWLNSRM